MADAGSIDFTPLNDVRCLLGEGPTWDADRNGLWYVDIDGRALHFADVGSGAHRQWPFDSEVCSLGIAESGRIVLALRKSVGLFDPETGHFNEIATIEPGVDTRNNDGKVGADGAFWVGTMNDRDEAVKAPIASLWRVTADGTVEKKVEQLVTSNGLAFSPDGRTMFHTDSRGPWIDRWDFDPATGAIANRTRIATLDDASGRPDGGATDADGCYWSSGITAQRLNRFNRDGRLLTWYPVPVAAPTMPCFGGRDLTTLYVTSLRAGRTPEMLEKYPLTGITLVAPSPVAGSPVSKFKDS